MTKVRDYKDLIIWQKGRELVKLSYQLSAQLPDSEKYGLRSQLQRASISIPTNIAEGYLRGSRKEYLYFLAVAAGSASEAETLCILAKDLGLVQDKEYKNIIELIIEIRKIFFTLRKKLKSE